MRFGHDLREIQDENGVALSLLESTLRLSVEERCPGVGDGLSDERHGTAGRELQRAAERRRSAQRDDYVLARRLLPHHAICRELHLWDKP